APYFCTHREPDPEKEFMSWLKLSEDLTLLCEKLNIESPYMVGHSMGATLITIANAVYGLKARKMVLVEPIYLPEETYRTKIRLQKHPLASKSIKRRNGWKDEAEAETYLRSKKMFQDWDEEAIRLYISYGMVKNGNGFMRLACPPEREAALFLGGSEYNPWPLLPKITCPVMVVEGEKSINRTVIDLKKATAAFPKGSYTEVNGAGHLIPMEKPAAVSGIIKKFLTEQYD
ncbi:MAG: alpha/beta hydrolase, partial [Deltaproteobacteria bacterium]|nr:alpha/beta hydrolase [Deltaproteobacteria bacterium]